MLILLTFIICKFTPFFQISMISLLFIFIYLYGIDCLLFQYCVLATSLIMKIMFFLSFSSSAMIHHMLLLSELFLKISKLIYRRSTPNPNLSWSNCIPKLQFCQNFQINDQFGIKHNPMKINISFFSLLNLEYQIVTYVIAFILSVIVNSYILTNLNKKKYDPIQKVLNITYEINKKIR